MSNLYVGKIKIEPLAKYVTNNSLMVNGNRVDYCSKVADVSGLHIGNYSINSKEKATWTINKVSTTWTGERMNVKIDLSTSRVTTGLYKPYAAYNNGTSGTTAWYTGHGAGGTKSIRSISKPSGNVNGAGSGSQYSFTIPTSVLSTFGIQETQKKINITFPYNDSDYALVVSSNKIQSKYLPHCTLHFKDDTSVQLISWIVVTDDKAPKGEMDDFNLKDKSTWINKPTSTGIVRNDNHNKVTTITM